jgi:hypothetical protein
MGTDRLTDDTEANTIARPLYLFFITIVIIKEGRAKKWNWKEISCLNWRGSSAYKQSLLLLFSFGISLVEILHPTIGEKCGIVTIIKRQIGTEL